MGAVESTFDEMVGVGLAMLLVPIIAWVYCGYRQHGFLKESTLRLQQLSTRTSMFLPAYSFFMWISLIAPEVGVALEIPVSIVEGYRLTFFIN